MSEIISKGLPETKAVRMFGHADCNSFYCNAETIFFPWLREKPIITVSNNDLCAIAINPPAKAFGISMATPLYQIADIIKENNIIIFSSNYELYSEIQSRMIMFYYQFVDRLEISSIDECFLDFTGYEHFGYEEYGRMIVRRAAKEMRMPICLGIAPTKALAKAANKLAKRDKERKGFYIISTEEERIEALKNLPVGDVWGIGRRYRDFLMANDVNTAYDFTCKPQKWVRKHMTVEGERLWLELHGISCLSLETVPPDKKATCTSRSFQKAVTEYDDLLAAVSLYLDSCAKKLRRQGSMAKILYVAIQTNKWKDISKQCFKGMAIELPVPSNNTIEMLPYAKKVLQAIYPQYKPGQKKYEFIKAGVTLTGLVPVGARQLDLYDSIDIERQSKINNLQKVIDEINGGLNIENRLVRLASEYTRTNDIKLRREKLSANPLAKWEDRMVISV